MTKRGTHKGGGGKAWLQDTKEAETKIWLALEEASKRHERGYINNRTIARDHARRLGETGRIFRELLGAIRVNGKEILTTGEGNEKDFLYTAE